MASKLVEAQAKRPEVVRASTQPFDVGLPSASGSSRAGARRSAGPRATTSYARDVLASAGVHAPTRRWPSDLTKPFDAVSQEGTVRTRARSRCRQAACGSLDAGRMARRRRGSSRRPRAPTSTDTDSWQVTPEGGQARTTADAAKAMDALLANALVRAARLGAFAAADGEAPGWTSAALVVSGGELRRWQVRACAVWATAGDRYVR